MTSTSIQHRVHLPTAQDSSMKDGLAAPPVLVGSRNKTVSPPSLPHDGGQPDNMVPNPFAVASAEVAMPNTVSASSMTSVNWGSPSSSPVPQFAPQPEPSNPGPVVIAASGIRVPGSQSSGGNSPSTSPAPARRKSSTQKETGGPNNRRQKRLERNRESARLSRRRRKQYLEVLEDRVSQLSIEMDQGRREHVAAAIRTIQEKRHQALQNYSLGALETNLSRASRELRVAATFQMQQLQSLVYAPHTKFLLWLSLQTDAYFRGGRAASERLSAARIGERMLSSGNDRVPPAHGMWPLLCNEVGLSYDQEERVRTCQRTLVQAPESWLVRHAGAASGLVMQSAHDCIQSLYHSLGERERAVLSVLTEPQRIKFLQWAADNKARLARNQQEKVSQVNDGYALSCDNHDAANLYIINHRLQMALNKLPTPPALVVGSSVKRLSRRPSFESLGSSGALSERQQKEENRALSRDSSFSSSGSLKRSASELDMEDERALAQSVSPEDAEVAAQPVIDAALGFVRDIMPLRPQPQPESVPSFTIPRSSKAAPEPHHPYQSLETGQALQPQPIMSAPAAYGAAQQNPIQSFLPQPLNAVPEEGFLAHQGSSDPADDFLFELAEEDWAIGEGFEMDTA